MCYTDVSDLILQFKNGPDSFVNRTTHNEAALTEIYNLSYSRRGFTSTSNNAHCIMNLKIEFGSSVRALLSINTVVSSGSSTS